MKVLIGIALSCVLSLAAIAQESTAPSPPPGPEQPQSTGALSQRGYERIVKEVRHELVMLPFYGVFDNLSYSVSPDGTVTLMGQVSRPTLKSDAENVVKKIEGVEKVVNNIEVLPASPMDDRIRRATYRAIYGNTVLSQYALGQCRPSTSL